MEKHTEILKLQKTVQHQNSEKCGQQESSLKIVIEQTKVKKTP